MSMAPAAFSGTTLYCGRKNHPTLGQIEVLGYQNKAVNLAGTPNAMILHVPAQLTPDNFLWVGEHNDILTRMVDAIRPVSAGFGSAPRSASADVQVFDHDIYTIVLAADPARIPAALVQVPEHKRPPLDPDLFAFYGKAFPYHSIVLCCFDNAEAYRASPLLIWYPPPYSDWLVMPALDGHTGRVPDLSSPVQTDHWLVFGADDSPHGQTVAYSSATPASLRAFLPDRVVGVQHSAAAANGDFGLPLSSQQGSLGIARLQPAF